MKKNFFKKLASGLALAMVVTSFAPAAPAFAAAATKIVEQGGKTAPQTVYVGKKVDYSLNNVYKTNTYKWFTSNAKIAKITQTGGVVTPVAPGKATIKVNAYKKSTGKLIKAFKLDLDVKLRATSVSIGAEDFELAVGEKKDLDAVKTPANSTDTLRYFSSNEKVATVDTKTGIVTAVAAGEATIKVAAKGAWFTANNSKYNKYDEVKVTVVDGLLKVDQKAYNKLELTFSSDMEKAGLKVADFSIVRDETNRVLPVKSVSVDGKVVTLTTFESMVDGKVYSVAHADKKLQFTATDNVVASLAIAPATIAFNSATDITVSTVDAKGVILGTYKMSDAGTQANLEFAVTTTQGYTTGDKLVLFAVGNTAKATATYHTYKYDTNGNELGAIKTELTITAVDQVASNIVKHEYTVAKKAPNWNSFTPNARLAIKDDFYYLYLKASKADGTSVSLVDYTYESSNADILLVQNMGAGLAPAVKAVGQGAAYVLVKDAKGTVVLSLPVTVVAERISGSIVVTTNGVVVSNTQQVKDKKVVKVTVKDQYGDAISGKNLTASNVQCLATSGVGVPAATAVNGSNYFTASGDTVEFYGKGLTAGTYTYKITVDGFSQTVTVTVQNANSNGTVSYALALDTNSVDTTFTSDDVKAPRTVEVRVAELRDGILWDYVPFAQGDDANGVDDTNLNNGNITIQRGNTVVTGSSIGVDAEGKEVLTFTALDTSSNTFAKKAVGSYSVRVDHNNHRLTGGFVVSDNQSPVTFRRTNIALQSNLTVEQAVDQSFDFFYEGYLLNGANANVASNLKVTASEITVAPITITSGSQRHIESVTVYVGIDLGANGGVVRVPVKVNIGQTISW